MPRQHQAYQGAAGKTRTGEERRNGGAAASLVGVRKLAPGLVCMYDGSSTHQHGPAGLEHMVVIEAEGVRAVLDAAPVPRHLDHTQAS